MLEFNPAYQGGYGLSDNSDSDWGVVSSGYKATGIYSKSTDGNGHSELLHLKVPPNINARVAEVCAEIKTYRTTHDFIRDAIVHRLHWYAEQKKLGKLNVPKLDFAIIEQEMFRMEQEVEEIKKFIERLPNRLVDAKKDRDRRRFQALTDLCQQMLVDESVGEPYWTEIRDVLKRDGKWEER